MKLLEQIFGRLKYHRRVQSWVVVAFCCCVSASGFAQLIYLTDTRSVSGSAGVSTFGLETPPYFFTSNSNFSGSATPSAPFADFGAGVSGSALLVGGFSNPVTGQLSPFTNSPTLNASQSSFLHSQELYFNSSVSDFNFTTGSGTWFATGNSALQVTFSVSAAVAYNLSVGGLGDPAGTGDSYNLSSAARGVLVNGSTASMVMLGQYGPGIRINYSGIFNPGDVYTLTLQATRNDGGFAPDNFPEIGGLLVDLTVVPEPSMTALAGLAFVIFLMRVRRIRLRA